MPVPALTNFCVFLGCKKKKKVLLFIRQRASHLSGTSMRRTLNKRNCYSSDILDSESVDSVGWEKKSDCCSREHARNAKMTKVTNDTV